MSSRCHRLPFLAAALGAVLALPRLAHAQAADSAAAARAAHVTRFVEAAFAWTHFSDATDPWQLGSVAAGWRASAGTVIARGNVASRFGDTGAQLELDAYPRLSRSTYAYLNVGYSGSAIFPRWRSGAELYAALPRGWEASAGYRQLRFPGAPVTLLTGSAGLYAGDWWLSVRPYVRVDDADSAGTSASFTLSARRYGAGGADDYVGATIGAGSTPSDRLAPGEPARTGAFTAALQGARPVTPRVVLTWTAGGEREQLPGGARRTRVELGAGVRVGY